MSALNDSMTSLAPLAALPTDFFQPNWYAVQLAVNQEKKVASRLQERHIECFLPLYQEVRRRTDRKVVLQMPLFPGYVFVRIALPDRLKVLEIPRVVRLVGFGPTPLAIPVTDIETLRTGLALRPAMPHLYLQVGRRVRVVAGPFEGMQGILVRRKGSLRVVVSIDAILSSFTVEVDDSEIEPIRGQGAPRNHSRSHRISCS
jgi:transcription antitermination factor NusG